MANIKITGYAELAAPISTDVIEVVSDPGGTPISKKVQIRNLFKGGGQIAFPATAVPSADPNTMDDWEEGTFGEVGTNGILIAATGTITCGTFYLCSYTKTGRLVVCGGDVTVTAVNTQSGSTNVLLPFTVADRSSATRGGVILVESIDYTADYIAGQGLKNTNVMRIRQVVDNVGLTNLDAAGFGVNSEVIWSISFEI